MNSLFCILSFLTLAAAQNLTRHVRQAKYICGSDPYRFFSDVPCNLARQCVNGGFKMDIGCTNDFQCQIYKADSVCIDSCCCSIPRFIGPPTTQIFRDQGTSPISVILAGLVTLFIML